MQLILIVIFTSSCGKDNQEEPPVTQKLTTMDISNISYTVAKCGGIYEYGFIPNRKGLCWNTTGDPTYSDNHISNYENDTSSFESKIYRLKPNTTYFIRAYAELWGEYYYGETKHFTTRTYDSIIDIRDNNIYRYAEIGDQYWLIDNLKYLPSVNNPIEESDITPMYYVYNYFGSDLEDAKSHHNYETYGVLYNRKSIEGSCPSGWHVPSPSDWEKLTEFVEEDEKPMNYQVAHALKSMGTIEDGTGLWKSSQYEGINSVGFSAIPSGHRFTAGTFLELGKRVTFWMDDNDNSFDKGSIMLFYDSWSLSYYYDLDYLAKDVGASIRCIKD